MLFLFFLLNFNTGIWCIYICLMGSFVRWPGIVHDLHTKYPLLLAGRLCALSYDLALLFTLWAGELCVRRLCERALRTAYTIRVPKDLVQSTTYAPISATHGCFMLFCRFHVHFLRFMSGRSTLSDLQK